MLIDLDVTGSEPRVGSVLNYRITVRNPDTRDTSGLIIRMQLQPGLSLDSVDFVMQPQVIGNELIWDLTNNPSTGLPLTIGPNGTTDRIIIDFSVRINAENAGGNPYVTTAIAEYYDPAYTYPGPRNSVMSDQSFYPQGKVVVYPNPFSKSKDKTVKFDNVVPGSVVQVFTIAGESVTSLQADEMKVYWNTKNSAGQYVSPGIYYFIITNQKSKAVLKGKLFVTQ